MTKQEMRDKIADGLAHEVVEHLQLQGHDTQDFQSFIERETITQNLVRTKTQWDSAAYQGMNERNDKECSALLQYIDKKFS